MVWHFDLGQTLGVEYIVFLNNAIFVEQESSQGVYLVGF